MVADSVSPTTGVVVDSATLEITGNVFASVAVFEVTAVPAPVASDGVTVTVNVAFFAVGSGIV
jgi:hypothetical protein